MTDTQIWPLLPTRRRKDGQVRTPDANTTPTTKPARELELVRATRCGDTSAAAKLASDSYEVVFRWLLRLVSGDREQAAELTQETFRIAWASLDSFRGRSRFTTWLYRIAYNTFLQERRKRSRFLPLSDDVAHGIPDDAPSPPDSLDRRNQAVRMRALVLALPDEQRFVVTARFWAGLSSSDIAALEGVGDAAIRKRLRKALRRLAASYERTS